MPPITNGRREQIRTLAKRYKRDERAFVTCQSFHPLVQQGMNAGCKLILAGQREVALFSGRDRLHRTSQFTFGMYGYPVA
jgi:hypothetical protein